MLMTRSTPRMTYRIGMRARFGAAGDKSFPGLSWEAPSVEVAADFTGIYRILMWRESEEAETVRFAITKVPTRMPRPAQVSKKIRLGKPRALGSEGFALAAACHQLINRFSRIFTMLQDGVHLLGDGHFDSTSAGQPHRRCRREDSFRNHAMHSGEDL